MTSASATAILDCDKPLTAGDGQPCLVHIYPAGPTLGKRHLLGIEPLVIGRETDCDIRAASNAVSRHHARLEFTDDGYRVVDLRSTNGVFVNDAPANSALLRDGDYLRIGNCIFRYLSGGNVEAHYHEEIHRLVIMDALTGTHNRRYLQEFLDRELARSARYGRSLALIMFDLDFFKAINDRLGHLAGDYALQEVATTVKASVRKEELLARYGGEEFALVLVECSREAALDVAERVRQLVEKQSFQFEDKPFRLTISLGVASTAGDAEVTVKDLIRRADENLYRAKAEGRNRVAG